MSGPWVDPLPAASLDAGIKVPENIIQFDGNYSLHENQAVQGPRLLDAVGRMVLTVPSRSFGEARPGPVLTVSVSMASVGSLPAN